MRTMKDSGVEWIGSIPTDWTTGKTLYGLSMPITDGPHETPELFDEGIPFVSAEAISSNNGHIDFEHIRGYVSEDYYQECCKKYKPELHDIYMIKSGATTGKVALVETDQVFTIWSPLAVFRCDESKCHYRYLFYFLQSDAYQKQVENMWSFGTQQNIGMRTLEKNIICFPTLHEQQMISDYLDRKSHEVDELIANREKANKLLQERRQSIIYEAVTKGLDPNAPLKDSGIEWIGQIPESWNIYRLKFLLSHGKDAMKAGPFGSSLTASDMQGSDVKVFNQRSVLDNDFEEGDEYVSVEKSKELKGFMVNEGDILITTRGTIGKTAIVPIGKQGILHPCLIKMVIDESVFVKPLLCRIFNETNLLTEQLRLASNATTIDVIYTQNLLNLFIPVPPIDEQRQIEQYLEGRCSEIDKMISLNDSSIQKLKEYRQSLIYEAVTGKIEV